MSTTDRTRAGGAAVVGGGGGAAVVEGVGAGAGVVDVGDGTVVEDVDRPAGATVVTTAADFDADEAASSEAAPAPWPQDARRHATAKAAAVKRMVDRGYRSTNG